MKAPAENSTVSPGPLTCDPSRDSASSRAPVPAGLAAAHSSLGRQEVAPGPQEEEPAAAETQGPDACHILRLSAEPAAAAAHSPRLRQALPRTPAATFDLHRCLSLPAWKGGAAR